MNAQSTQGPTHTQDTPPEVDAIVAALGKLRGRRHLPGDPRRGGPHRPGPHSAGPHGTGPLNAGPYNAGPHDPQLQHPGTHGDMRGDAQFGMPPHASMGGETPGDDPHRGPGGHERFGGPALLRMLGALAHADTPRTVSEIADVIGVDQPRASRLVQQAVAKGFAEREADPADARRTRVRLTDAGTLAVHGFRGRQRDDVSTALAALEPAERTELARLMTKLAAAWPTR